jgi:hypothetical protein
MEGDSITVSVIPMNREIRFIRKKSGDSEYTDALYANETDRS